MEIANNNGTGSSNFREQVCNCYKVGDLSETILGASHISSLKDRYVLEEQLGWGQFGIIRACSDKLTGEVLACKSIAKDRLVTLDDVRSVKLEIEIMSRLSGHPNVVNLKAVYEEEDYVHLLMELCGGGELFHRLEKHGRFSEMEARALFKQLMQVVKYCHDNGIVHRDLKPENILLVSTSSSSPIKLADFGLATYIQPGQSLHGTVGSPFYIAPEVLGGGYSQAADVWSAGVILYILLSGVPPFWGKTKSKIFDAVRAANLRFPASHWDSISAAAKDLIAGMLRFDPSKRFTAAEVLVHPWMEFRGQVVNNTSKPDDMGHGMFEVGGGSFSTPLIDRAQDYSFNYESHAVDGSSIEQLTTFTCKSSFSSYLEGNETPYSGVEGFSFSSVCKPSSVDAGFPASLLSLPSFTFSSSAPEAEKGNEFLGFNVKMSIAGISNGESSLDKIFAFPLDSSVCSKREIDAEQKSESRKAGTNGTRLLGIHSKRNHTIGFGELDQIDIVVTESVIRWASCTHIPTPPSLRLSLVC